VQLIPVGADQTGTASLLLTGLAISAKPLEGVVGVRYHTTFKAKPGESLYTWAVTGALPAGLTLDASTGVVSGKPTATGTSTFTMTVTDGGFHTASVAKSITVVEPLEVTTTSLPGGTVSDEYSETLAASGGTTPYTWSVNPSLLPPGLSLDAATGTISGLPSAAGTYDFTVTVTDSTKKPLTASAPLSITISS